MISELFLALFIILLLFEVWKHFSKTKNLPPGPFRWPILGNVIEMKLANAKYPHLALASMAKKYGDVMSLGFGVHYSVVVSSYDAMKDIFKRPVTTLGRFEFPYVPDRAFQKNLGIIWSNGMVWREMRRFTIKTLKDFGLGKTQLLESIIIEEMNDIVHYIKMWSGSNNGILDNF